MLRCQSRGTARYLPWSPAMTRLAAGQRYRVFMNRGRVQHNIDPAIPAGPSPGGAIQSGRPGSSCDLRHWAHRASRRRYAERNAGAGVTAGNQEA